MTISLAIAFLCLHCAFIWGHFAVFRAEGRKPTGVRLVEVAALSFIAAGATAILRRDGPDALFDGLAIMTTLLSGGLFLWAFLTVRRGKLSRVFSVDLPTELIAEGPFRFIRNPFYVAYIVSYCQAVIASRALWAMIPVIFMTGLYNRAARFEEQKFMRSSLADAYRRYAARTGRFLPFLPRLIRLKSRAPLEPLDRS